MPATPLAGARGVCLGGETTNAYFIYIFRTRIVFVGLTFICEQFVTEEDIYDIYIYRGYMYVNMEMEGGPETRIALKDSLDVHSCIILHSI